MIYETWAIDQAHPREVERSDGETIAVCKTWDVAYLVAQAPALARALLRLRDQLSNPVPSIAMLRADMAKTERVLKDAGVLP